MKQHGKDRGDTRRERRPYERPTFREFGPVGQLTQSGTGTRAESNQTGVGQEMRQLPRP
jgi:hypothetical protein